MFHKSWICKMQSKVSVLYDTIICLLIVFANPAALHLIDFISKRKSCAEKLQFKVFEQTYNILKFTCTGRRKKKTKVSARKNLYRVMPPYRVLKLQEAARKWEFSVFPIRIWNFAVPACLRNFNTQIWTGRQYITHFRSFRRELT